MRRLLSWTVALAMLFGVVGTTIAADKPKASPEERFAKMDKNGDGKLSEDEFIGKKSGEMADKAKMQFKRLDKDGDGFVTLDEFKAAGKKK